MEKQSHSKLKISHVILCTIFSILFIFTALNISTTLTAYARPADYDDTAFINSRLYSLR